MSVRAVLIRGQDDLFTIGDDLGDLLGHRSDYLDARAHFLRILATFEKPLLAAVAGDAKGIGTALLLHCDLVYAADNARFQLPFVSLALCPDGGSSRLLPRLGGHRLASELLLLGEPFGPGKAHQAGIVNAIFPTDDLVGKAMAAAEKLAAQPQQAVAMAKSLMKSPDEQDALEAIRLEAFHLSELVEMPSARERIAAFLGEQTACPDKVHG